MFLCSLLNKSVIDTGNTGATSMTSATSSPLSSSPTLAMPLFDTKPPKGTRDFFPIDMRQRNWLFQQWKNIAQQYGFIEYDAPIVESESLYTRKAGEEVTQQLYNFVDKGNRTVSLRPEMTPSLARMVLSQYGALSFPFKWFAIPQCWRYERMTRGRRREHYQWNMDIWGVASVQAEAELVSAMVSFFTAVGLSSSDVGIKVNSRLVIAEVLTGLGIPPEKFAATCVLVDKLEKVPIEAIQEDLQALGIERHVIESLITVLSTNSIDALAQSLGAESEAVQQLTQFLQLCDAYGIREWMVFDASVVRGLAYYTGIVFEAFDRQGQLRAIAGGGRYDKLLETYGGTSTPAVGFGFGDAVIIELLKERNLLPSFDKANIDIVVFAMTPNLFTVAIQIATQLRQSASTCTNTNVKHENHHSARPPLGVDLVLEHKKTKWVLKYADRLGARYCFIIGNDEYAEGKVAVKDLSTGTQESIEIQSLSEWIERNQIISF
jgi:histidyl-tRNA synthetase